MEEYKDIFNRIGFFGESILKSSYKNMMIRAKAETIIPQDGSIVFEVELDIIPISSYTVEVMIERRFYGWHDPDKYDDIYDEKGKFVKRIMAVEGVKKPLTEMGRGVIGILTKPLEIKPTINEFGPGLLVQGEYETLDEEDSRANEASIIIEGYCNKGLEDVLRYVRLK